MPAHSLSGTSAAEVAALQATPPPRAKSTLRARTERLGAPQQLPGRHRLGWERYHHLITAQAPATQRCQPSAAGFKRSVLSCTSATAQAAQRDGRTRMRRRISSIRCACAALSSVALQATRNYARFLGLLLHLNASACDIFNSVVTLLWLSICADCQTLT